MTWTKAPEDERRRQIVDAATRTAARTGVRGLTLRAVAAEAGLSHGLVLFHFGSKQALVDAVLDAVLAWLATRTVPDGERRPVWDVVVAESAAVDGSAALVLLDFWVLAASEDVVRERIAEAVHRYQQRLAEVLVGADGDERGRLAGVAVTTIFGSALRGLLDPTARDRFVRDLGAVR